tara:strand:- start:26 stop:904 length:879 start_codon:yes stop_codon:yes gene_type:complete
MADDGFSDVADVTDEGYDFAPDPSSVGMDSGDNSEAYNSAVENQTPKQAYTTMRGATATNPFPESFFSQMFGAENVNYTNIIGSDRIAEINDLRYNQATGGMSNRTGANTGKPYQMGDYYIGQPTQMGTVREVPQTGIMSVMDNLPYIGSISNILGRNRGLPENDPRRIAMMEEQAKSANDPTVFDRTSDFVKSILGLDPKDSGASLAASPIGEGQMRVPDNRTFDAFGNVTGSSLNTTSGIGTINKEVTNNAVNNIVSDNMIGNNEGYSTVNTIGNMTKEEADRIKNRLNY